MPITDANRHLLRSAYEARTTQEPPLLVRWFEQTWAGSLIAHAEVNLTPFLLHTGQNAHEQPGAPK